MIPAVLDACVLYRAAIRDLLMRLAAAGVYSPRWTQDIQDEWVRHVLKTNRHISAAQLEQTCHPMAQVDHASLVCGYEQHIPSLTLPDPDDRHVLAAAIHCSAPHIVTYNLKDFPNAALAYYKVRAVHPDVFLCALMEEEPSQFLQAVQRHRAALKNPPKSAQEYLSTLLASALPELVRRLDDHTTTI